MIFRYVKAVVRICHGREGWQAVGSVGHKSNPTPFSIMPAHLRRAQTPNRCPQFYRSLQPYGLVRVRNSVLLMRSRMLTRSNQQPQANQQRSYSTAAGSYRSASDGQPVTLRPVSNLRISASSVRCSGFCVPYCSSSFYWRIIHPGFLICCL